MQQEIGDTMSYAVNTNVSIEKSKGEIERMLTRYGADRFMAGHDAQYAFVAFQCHGKMVKFVLPLPDRKDNKFWATSKQKRRRSPEDAYLAWEQACRSRYRALCLSIKAKLEAIEANIATFEEEFLPHFVMADGATFGQYAIPRLEEASKKGKLPQLQIGFVTDEKHHDV